MSFIFFSQHEECLREIKFFKDKAFELENENITLREQLHTSESYTSDLRTKVSKLKHDL